MYLQDLDPQQMFSFAKAAVKYGQVQQSIASKSCSFVHTLSKVSCTLGYKEMVSLRQCLLPAAWPGPFTSDSLLQGRLPSWPPPLSQVMKKENL